MLSGLPCNLHPRYQMKLNFETNNLTLPEARDMAETILSDLASRRRLNRLDVADVCAYILEPRRKSADSEKTKEDES